MPQSTQFNPLGSRLRQTATGTALALGFLLAGCGSGGRDPGPPISPGGDSSPDPLYEHQWHLVNDGQAGGTAGEDVRANAAWDMGRSGAGVRIAVVDDGLEIGHEDLAANVVPGKSFNYVDGTSDPTGGSHGTSCAGVAAARRGNNKGGTGIAYEAELVGYNLLQFNTDVNQFHAMTHNAEEVWISTNSWGAADGQGVPQPSSDTWQMAVDQGLVGGRNGKGTVYFWAAGNGARPEAEEIQWDNSNYDGQANYYGVIAVGAVGDDGKRADYSEPGANLLICAPSQGNNDHAITTVDRSGDDGYNNGASPSNYADPNYTNTFNGTSSATPLAAGVGALVLEARPDLGWLDVRKILALSARKNDPSHPDWTTNGAGLWINHNYGFGVVDAETALERAQDWVLLPDPGLDMTEMLLGPHLPIPDDDPGGVSTQVTLGNPALMIFEIESVHITLDIDHPYNGDLEVVLESPAGTKSVLTERHWSESGSTQYTHAHVFSSTRHLNESAFGTWTLRVRDLWSGLEGTLKGWSIRIIGT